MKNLIKLSAFKNAKQRCNHSLLKKVFSFVLLSFFALNAINSQVVFNKEYVPNISSPTVYATGIYITKIVQENISPFDYYFIGVYNTGQVNSKTIVNYSVIGKINLDGALTALEITGSPAENGFNDIVLGQDATNNLNVIVNCGEQYHTPTSIRVGKVLAFDRNLNAVWAFEDFNSTYSWNSFFSEIIKTVDVNGNDDGYTLVGHTLNQGNGNNYQKDILVVHITNSGALSWAKTFDIDSYSTDEGISIYQTHDGGYAVLANYNSNVCLIKLTNSGAISWKKSYNNSNSAISALKVREYYDNTNSTYFHKIAGKYNGKLFLFDADNSGANLTNMKEYYENNVTLGFHDVKFYDNEILISCHINSFTKGAVIQIPFSTNTPVYKKFANSKSISSTTKTRDKGYILGGWSNNNEFLGIKTDGNLSTSDPNSSCEPTTLSLSNAAISITESSVSGTATSNINGTAFQGTTDSVSWTTTNLCDNICVNTAPSITSSCTEGFCTGCTISIPDIGYEYQWQELIAGNWTDIAGETNYHYVATNAGTYRVNIWWSPQCSTSTAAAVIAIPPVISYQPNPLSTCLNVGKNVVMLGATNYQWVTWNSGYDVSNNAANSDVTLNPPVTTIYTVKGWSGTPGCTTTVQLNLAVLLLPAVSIASSSPTTCSTNPVTLTASGAMTYTWSENGNVFSTNNPITVSPATTTTYTLTGTDGNGCENTATETVTILSLPTFNISPNPANICAAGGSQTFTCSLNAGYDFEWTEVGGNGTVLSTTNTLTITNISASKQYKLKVTNSNTTCFSEQTVALNIRLKPIPAFTFDEICIGTASSFTDQSTGNGGSNLVSWTYDFGDNTTSTFSSNPGTFTHTYTPPVNTTNAGYKTYTVRLTVSDNNGPGGSSGCTEYIDHDVKVYYIPAAATISNVTICSGNTATLAVQNPIAGVRYEWYTGFPSGNTPITANHITTNSPGTSYTTGVLTSNGANPSITQFHVVAYGGGIGSCFLNLVVVDVTVNPMPATPTITFPTTSSYDICPSNGFTFTSAQINNVTKEWYEDGLAQGVSTDNYAPQNFSAVTTWTAHEYKVSVFNSAFPTCEAFSSPVTLNIRPAEVQLTAQAVNICNNGSVVLYPKSTTWSQTYIWYKQGNANSICSTANCSLSNVMASAVYYYVATNSINNNTQHCTATSANYSVNMAAPFVISGSNSLTTPSVLTAPSGGFPSYGATYKWYRNGVQVAGMCNCPTFTATTPGTYYCVATGCGVQTSNQLTTVSPCNTAGYTVLNAGALSNITSNTRLATINGVYTVNGNISISNATLEIASGVRILVNGGATLNISNSNLKGCDHWQGIEVTGNPANDRPANTHGTVNMTNSTITDAVVAVYSSGGGKLNLSGNTFNNNNTHIVIRNYGSYAHNSTINGSNTFGTLMTITPRTSTNFASMRNSSIQKMIYMENVWGVVIDNNTFTGNAYPLAAANKYAIEGYNITQLINTTVNITNAQISGDFTDGIHTELVSKAIISGVAPYNTNNSMTINGNMTNGVYVSGGSKNKVSYVNFGNTNGTPMKAGVLFSQSDDGSIYSNNLYNVTDGVQYYQSAATQTNTYIQKNLFQQCVNGLVVSPTCHPIDMVPGVANCSNTSPNIIKVQILCNKFYANTQAMVGSGYMNDQGSAGDEAANDVGSNSNWDLIWGTSTGTLFYHSNLGGRTQFNAASTSKQNLFINGVSISTTLWDGFPINNIGNCYGTWKSDPSLGITNVVNADIKIFPNPTKDLLNIWLPEGLVASISIFDAQGKQMLVNVSGASNLKEVNTETWPAGVYLIKIANSNFDVVHRVVKIAE